MEDDQALSEIRKRLQAIEAYLDHQSSGWRGFAGLQMMANPGEIDCTIAPPTSLGGRWIRT
jgi:hypothetical protein